MLGRFQAKHEVELPAKVQWLPKIGALHAGRVDPHEARRHLCVLDTEHVLRSTLQRSGEPGARSASHVEHRSGKLPSEDGAQRLTRTGHAMPSLGGLVIVIYQAR